MIKTNEFKSIIQIALPLIAAFLAQKSMQFIDTIMMGWIGPDALAAGALGTGIYMTILVFCMGTLSAVGVLISRARGAGDEADITISMCNGIVLTLLLCIPCMILIWESPRILLMIGEKAAVVQNTKLLLHALVLGFPGFLLFLIFREFVSSFSLTRIVMLVCFISMPFTFCANYVLIYGKYHFPALGIAGIGYAGAIVMWFMFLCLLIYSLKNPILKKFLSFKFFRIEKNKIYDILYIGIPSGTLFILESGMFLAATILMGYFGVTTLAAYQISMQCAIIAYAIPFALGMSTALLVGHAVGAKDIARAKQITTITMLMGLGIATLMAGFYIFTPNLLVKIFLQPGVKDYAQISHLAASFLFIAVFFQLFDAVQAIANGALRGLKDTFIPMLISVGCYWLIGVCGEYYFSFYTRLGPEGIWIGLTLGICSVGIILMYRLFKIFKKLQPCTNSPL